MKFCALHIEINKIKSMKIWQLKNEHSQGHSVALTALLCGAGEGAQIWADYVLLQEHLVDCHFTGNNIFSKQQRLEFIRDSSGTVYA